MLTELPIKSKFLIFEYDSKEDSCFIYNKKTNEFLATISKPSRSSSYWWTMEKGIAFDERCTRDILEALEYLKKVKTL